MHYFIYSSLHPYDYSCPQWTKKETEAQKDCIICLSPYRKWWEVAQDQDEPGQSEPFPGLLMELLEIKHSIFAGISTMRTT